MSRTDTERTAGEAAGSRTASAHFAPDTLATETLAGVHVEPSIEAYIRRSRRLRAEYMASLLSAARGHLAALFGLRRPPQAGNRQAAATLLSHELKTPLTAIRSCSELLIEHPDMPGDHRERFLDSIHEEALRLEGAIDRILRLAEAEPRGLARRLTEAVKGLSVPARVDPAPMDHRKAA